MFDFLDTQQWILLSVIFYVCVLQLLTVYVFGARRSSVFEPISLFLLFVSLFALPLPARYLITREIEGDVSPFLEQFAPFLPIALLLTTFAIVAFVAAYYSPLSRRIGDALPLLRDRVATGTGASITVLILASAALIYLLTESLGGLIPFLLLGYKSSEETFGRGYLAIGFPWLVVATLGFLERFAVRRSVIDLVACALVGSAIVVMFVITGNRAMLMYLTISLLVFVNYRIRKVSFTILIPLAIAGFVSLNLLGTLRGSDYKDTEDFIDKTFGASESEAPTDKENFVYTLTIGEFVVPFETLPQMIRTVGVTQRPWLGMSYLRAPAFMIPGVLYPDRPLPLGNWYMQQYYGGGYGLNEGRQFFFLAEGYLNFGPIGVLLIALVWGVAWGALHRWMLRGRDRFGTVLIYALLVGFMIRCIAGDFGTVLVATSQQSLSAVAIILLLANLFGGRRNVVRGTVAA